MVKGRSHSLFELRKRLNQKYGGVAQLGEHLLCKQGVIGSIPFISTNKRKLVKKGPDKEGQRPNVQPINGLIAQVVRAHA